MALLGVVGVLLWKGAFRYRCVPNYLLDENATWFQEHCSSAGTCKYHKLGSGRDSTASLNWDMTDFT